MINAKRRYKMSKLPNSNNDTKDRPPRTPRWVKVSGIIVIILVLLFFILKLTGVGGNHGPGRHIQTGSDIVGHAPAIEQAEVQQS